jgi:hypothetical protein
VQDLRRGLLELHRVIVTAEREDFELMNGKVGAGEFLRVLIEDPRWEWLRPLSALIVQLDEQEAEEKKGQAADRGAPLAEARRLLKPDASGTPFQRRYADLIQRRPEILYAHGAVMQALRKPA